MKVSVRNTSRQRFLAASAAAEAVSRFGNRPYTAEPEPLITAPSAPLSSRQRFISPTACAARRSSASSNTLYIRRATPATSPARSAATSPSVSGRQRVRSVSSRAKSSGVEQVKCGMQITASVLGSGGSGVSTSPRPVASAVPPIRQNGTSEPARSAAAHSSPPSSGAPVSSPSARITAAASDEPPPSPAHTGMRFVILM